MLSTLSKHQLFQEQRRKLWYHVIKEIKTVRSTNDYLRYLNLKEHECYPPFSKMMSMPVGLQLYLKSSKTNSEVWLLLHSRNFSFCGTTLLHCSSILTKTPFELRAKSRRKNRAFATSWKILLALHTVKTSLHFSNSSWRTGIPTSNKISSVESCTYCKETSHSDVYIS